LAMDLVETRGPGNATGPLRCSAASRTSVHWCRKRTSDSTRSCRRTSCFSCFCVAACSTPCGFTLQSAQRTSQYLSYCTPSTCPPPRHVTSFSTVHSGSVVSITVSPPGKTMGQFWSSPRSLHHMPFCVKYDCENHAKPRWVEFWAVGVARGGRWQEGCVG
jgi:hypothetical protein